LLDGLRHIDITPTDRGTDVFLADLISVSEDPAEKEKS
jgi:hypothetical protein